MPPQEYCYRQQMHRIASAAACQPRLINDTDEAIPTSQFSKYRAY